MDLVYVVGIAAVAVARLAYLLVPIHSSPADEARYIAQARYTRERGLAGLYECRTPRPLHIALGAALMGPEKRGRALAWLSSIAGVATVALAGLIGWRLSGPEVGLVTAVLVGTSPLLVGLGRRALLDVPAVAAELLVVALALDGAEHWGRVAFGLVVMLLMRESARSALPGILLAVAWLWRWDWSAVGYAVAVGAPCYTLALRVLAGVWPWGFPTAFVERVLRGHPVPPGHYANRYCRGGAHRLLVDLVLVSPAVVMTALAFGGFWTWPAAAVWLGYSVPWLDQQIRSAMLVDVLLRVAVAAVVPLWGVALLVLVDLYVFHRLWLRGKLYDPSTTALGQILGMVAR